MFDVCRAAVRNHEQVLSADTLCVWSPSSGHDTLLQVTRTSSDWLISASKSCFSSDSDSLRWNRSDENSSSAEPDSGGSRISAAHGASSQHRIFFKFWFSHPTLQKSKPKKTTELQHDGLMARAAARYFLFVNWKLLISNQSKLLLTLSSPMTWRRWYSSWWQPLRVMAATTDHVNPERVHSISPGWTNTDRFIDPSEERSHKHNKWVKHKSGWKKTLLISCYCHICECSVAKTHLTVVGNCRLSLQACCWSHDSTSGQI